MPHSNLAVDNLRPRTNGPKRRLSRRLVPLHRLSAIDDRSLAGALQERQAPRTSSALARERAQLEQELADCKEEFRQFVNSMSHDLLAPLRAVTGFSQFLKQEYAASLDETADTYLEQICHGAGQMEKLVKGLVSYARIGTKTLEMETVDLNDVLEDVRASLHEVLEPASAVVKHPSLPSLNGDRQLLTLLLTQLVHNAVQFNQAKTPQIEIRADFQDDAWQISVADNGIGIDPKHASRVFEMFRSLNSRKQYSGAGAGLAICRRIVDRHHGKIWCAPNEHGGTTFCFLIPVEQDPATRIQQPL